LGLELVQRQRRNRARARRDSGLPRAVALLITQLPADEEALAHARVWEALTASHAGDPSAREFRDAWSAELDGLIAAITDGHAVLLRAVFDGLVQAVVQGRVELEDAHTRLFAYLESLGAPGWLAEAAEAERREDEQGEPRMTVFRA
jgi:hypothetical protein